MQAVDLIRKKRDGDILSTAEIDWLVEQYTREQIPDYQMSAWLMTVYWRGMNARETSDLTLAMARSGEELHVRDTISPVVDKHSTGGVGDKVTLAVAPADGKMYTLRDVTGTVESIPLIAASIMSKKLAIGASHLLLDVKAGSGAFMKNVQQARELARTMVDIGRLAGLHTVAAITSMEQPLGRAIGNALEMAEAIAILRGHGPLDVSELCYHEASELLVMTGSVKTMSEAEKRVEQAIRSGAAVAKLAEVIEAQGGDRRQVEQPELLPRAPVRMMLPAPHSGYIAAIEAEEVGLASMHLGAGRFKKGEQIDHRTGFILQAKVGDYRQAGEPLVEIHARSESEADSVREALLACYTWSGTPVTAGPLVYETIRP